MKNFSSKYSVLYLGTLLFSLLVVNNVTARSISPNDILLGLKSKSRNNRQKFRSRDIIALVPTKTSTGVRRGCDSDSNRIFKGVTSPSSSISRSGGVSYPTFDKQSYDMNMNMNINNEERDCRTILLSSRGGSLNENNEEVNKTNKTKKIGIAVTMALIVTLITLNKDTISAFDLKGELAKQLDVLSSMGTKGLVTFIFSFIIWELVVGVTTPVETAAGMAFGFKKAILANAIGKTSGAIFAFVLGRYVLKDYVTQKLEGNEYMDLVKDSITKNPIRVALIWRFSFLPEQIKNFGLAILPVKIWQFITAVLLHGFPFTLLWSFMGNEMGLVVRGIVDKPSKILKVLIAGVYVMGFFVSPSLVGLWVKGLRDEKLKREGKKG